MQQNCRWCSCDRMLPSVFYLYILDILMTIDFSPSQMNNSPRCFKFFYQLYESNDFNDLVILYFSLNQVIFYVNMLLFLIYLFIYYLIYVLYFLVHLNHYYFILFIYSRRIVFTGDSEKLWFILKSLLLYC